MKVIGITGSSGSGKTTITKIFGKQSKAKIIDADEVVKELSVPHTDYMQKIKENIGEKFFEENGYLNKKKLAQTIYTNKNILEKLNLLTFKYVVEEIERRVNEIKKIEEVSIVIIDAPLLIESGLDKICDYIIAVLANKEIKIQRICTRDDIDVKTAESRLNIQKNDEFYIKKSNFVIYNNGKENLEEEIEKILKQI